MAIIVTMSAAVLIAILLAGIRPVFAEGDRTDVGNHSGFAVVELFTSQGCSSCPPADENLTRIAEKAARQNLPVYTLSFHVDYWNNIGWKDPFSSRAATARQQQYSRILGSTQVYTPQMIINGVTQFVGSDLNRTDAALKAALATRPQGKLTATATREGATVQITWEDFGIDPADSIVVALVKNQAEAKVTAGENSGRKLAHVNVVHSFMVREIAVRSIVFEMPRTLKSHEFHFVAFAQSKADATIHAVTAMDIELMK